MKRVLALAALALFAAAPMASPAIAQQAHAESAAARHGVPVQRVVSPGGIEAWLVSDSTVPMLVLRAYWRGAGSSIEPERATGVSSAMADMLTEGAGDLDAQAFKTRLEELNMSLGFGAGWDGFSMSLTTLTENRDAAFAMARMALMQPRFDAAPLERLRRQWLIGIRQRDTNPSYISGLALDSALYPDHAYARRTTRESLAAINVAAMRARLALLARDQLQITVVGDIDPATLGRLLDDTFGALPATAALATTPDVSLRPATPLIVRTLPQPQSLVVFAGPGIQEDDPDWIPFAVANYILGGGGFSSRLMNEVRERRGLVYGVSMSASVRDHAALIRGSAQTENDNVAEAIEVIRAEMARFARDGATQAEVDDAITYLTGSFALDLDSNSGIAGIVHGYQTIGRDIDYINRRNDLIRAVRLEDVNRVARRLLGPDAFTFVVVGQPTGLTASAQ
jgi:zinc protease